MTVLSLKNDRLLKTIRREPVDATPIWIMRQAGRYLPEYRAVRAQAGSFMTLCKTPALACEVTMQPLKRYDLDAAIIFSDILTIPDAMGLGLTFIEGQGPVFAKNIQHEREIDHLQVPAEETLNYVYEAIRLVKQELDGRIPLIGFCGSPWTLAAYMVEGRSRPGFPAIQDMRAKAPAILHKLLNILAQSVASHLNAQIKAGAEVVMIFDTWGGLLGDSKQYEIFSLNYVKQVIKNLQRNYNNTMIPVILFTKGASRWLEMMAASGCDVLGLDADISLHEARSRIGQVNAQVALQGNLDPAIMLQNENQICEETARVLSSYGQGEGHIFNLGHGITPDVPPEHVAVLVEAVHRLSRPYHLAADEKI